MGHVEDVAFVKDPAQRKEILPLSDHFSGQIQRELVVPGRHGGVGGENAFFPNRIPIVTSDSVPSGLLGFFVQERQRE